MNIKLIFASLILIIGLSLFSYYFFHRKMPDSLKNIGHIKTLGDEENRLKTVNVKIYLKTIRFLLESYKNNSDIYTNDVNKLDISQIYSKNISFMLDTKIFLNQNEYVILYDNTSQNESKFVIFKDGNIYPISDKEIEINSFHEILKYIIINKIKTLN